MKTSCNIKIKLLSEKVNPTPPVGSTLGLKGLNIMSFCNAFNAKTASLEGVIRVSIKLYADGGIRLSIKTKTTKSSILAILHLPKGSGEPKTKILGTLSLEQQKQLCSYKSNEL